jgi:hypothetical protein
MILTGILVYLKVRKNAAVKLLARRDAVSCLFNHLSLKDKVRGMTFLGGGT